MKKHISLALILIASSAGAIAQSNYEARNIRSGGFQEQESGDIGEIQNMRRTTLQKQGEAGATGAVVGTVTGAVLGHQIGKGRGRTVSTVLGGALGGAVGNSIAQQNAVVNVPGLEIVVRLRSNGNLVTVTQEQQGRNFYIGQPVRIVYSQNIAQVIPM